MIKGALIKAKTAVVQPTDQHKTFQSRKESKKHSSQRLLLNWTVTPSAWAWVSGLTMMWAGVCHEKEICPSTDHELNKTNFLIKETSYNIKVSQQNK